MLRGVRALLQRNPGLARATLAAGLLTSALSVGGPLLLAGLRARLWGLRMSRNGARLNIATLLASLAFGGAFGRLTDFISLHRAMGLVGLLNFLPWYLLLALGPTDRGLWAHSAAIVLSGVTCMSPSGCPMIYAFAQEVLLPEDRAVGMGFAAAGTLAVALLAALLGSAVAARFPGEALPVSAYIALLSLGFFAALRGVKLQGRAGEGDAEAGKQAEAGEAAEKAEAAVSSESAGSGVENSGGKVALLAWRYAPLRNLCLTAALISLPEMALADVVTQFVYSTLHLTTAAEQQRAGVLTDTCGRLSLVPAYLLLGWLSKRCGALRALRGAIPLASLLLALPAALVFCKAMWFLPVLGVALNLAGVVFTPLHVVVAEVAPLGRVGECMASVGVAKQAGSMGANLLVAFLTPWLRREVTPWPEPFYFPVAGAVCLCACAFAAAVRLPGKPGEASS